MERLSDDGILGTATVKENRISGANQILDSKNALEKKTERGTYNFLTSWTDNSVCQVTSNCRQVGPIGKVQRWMKGKSQIRVS